MYEDEYVYNGPSSARHHHGPEGRYARSPRAYDDDSCDRVADGAPSRHSDLLGVLSQLHAQQEAVMAALLGVTPSTSASPDPYRHRAPPDDVFIEDDFSASAHLRPRWRQGLAASPTRRTEHATDSAWPERAPPAAARYPRARLDERRQSGHWMTGAVGDVHPLLPRSVVADRSSSPLQATMNDIYDTLFGRAIDEEVPGGRYVSSPAPHRRIPLPKSTATVEYYQRAASQGPATARTEGERVSTSVDTVHTSGTPHRLPEGGRPTRTRSAQSEATAPHGRPAPTSTTGTLKSRAARSLSAEVRTHTTRPDPPRPSAVRSGAGGVDVQPSKSAAWAFKLIESIESHIAVRRHESPAGAATSATSAPNRCDGVRGDNDAACVSAQTSVAALTAQCLSQRAGTLRWRALLTDLAASIHAYQYVCPACGVFRHYFIDSTSPKSVVQFRLFCSVWQAMLRSSHTVTHSVSMGTPDHAQLTRTRRGDEALSADGETSTLVVRRYVDLREVTMLLSVVLSALVVPEVRFVIGAGARRSQSSTPSPYFRRRFRRLHSREQRDAQQLLFDWMEQSIRQVRALRQASELGERRHDPGALAAANLLAFDREGFVDAHALAQATVEALDVLVPLHEPSSPSPAEAPPPSQAGTHRREAKAAARRAPIDSSSAGQIPRETAVAPLRAQLARPSSARPRVLPLPVHDYARSEFDTHGDGILAHGLIQRHWAEDAPHHSWVDPEDVDGGQAEAFDDEDAYLGDDGVRRDGRRGNGDSFQTSEKTLRESPAVALADDGQAPGSSGDDDSIPEEPVPQRRASTPPPSAVKHWRDRERSPDAPTQATPRGADSNNDTAYRPHALARRLLAMDVSDYLDDFAADSSAAVTGVPDAAVVETEVTADTTQDPRSVNDTAGRTDQSKDTTHARAERRTRVTGTPASSNTEARQAESSIRVLNRCASERPLLSPHSPPPAPSTTQPVMVGTITADSQQPLTALERYRQRQGAETAARVASASVDETKTPSHATDTDDRGTATTASLLQELRSRARTSDRHRSATAAATAAAATSVHDKATSH